MLASLSNAAIDNFDWVLGIILAANMLAFVVLAFVPSIHQRITTILTNFIQKL